MPYLKVHDREYFTKLEDALAHTAIETPGELNYLLTRVCQQALKDKTLNYTLLNAIVGALESAKAEFQRRVVNPYEINKAETNGDVY